MKISCSSQFHYRQIYSDSESHLSASENEIYKFCDGILIRYPASKTRMTLPISGCNLDSLNCLSVDRLTLVNDLDTTINYLRIHRHHIGGNLIVRGFYATVVDATGYHCLDVRNNPISSVRFCGQTVIKLNAECFEPLQPFAVPSLKYLCMQATGASLPNCEVCCRTRAELVTLYGFLKLLICPRCRINFPKYSIRSDGKYVYMKALLTVHLRTKTGVSVHEIPIGKKHISSINKLHPDLQISFSQGLGKYLDWKPSGWFLSRNSLQEFWIVSKPLRLKLDVD